MFSGIGAPELMIILVLVLILFGAGRLPAVFEQFGKGQTDARSDVYSLAATLYHLLTGKPPTPATTPISLRDLNPKVTPRTEALIIRAMSRDMDVRPQAAQSMEMELRHCLGRCSPPFSSMESQYCFTPLSGMKRCTIPCGTKT